MISETVNAAFENYVKPENQVVEEVKVEEQPQEVVVEIFGKDSALVKNISRMVKSIQNVVLNS